jgi:endoglucanase
MHRRHFTWKIKLVLSVIAFCSVLSCKQSPNDESMNPSGFIISRGTNLSHWLSQDFGWAPKYAYINENDLRFIDSIGYDHVRIPIDENELWDTLGNPNEVAFGYLTNCLDWCAKYNLRAIVDLHIVRAHHFNAANEGLSNSLWTDSIAQNNFINLWVKLSERLQKYPNNMVAYEILNEAVAPDPEDWNKLLNKTIATIRKTEPGRVVVVGPNRWQTADNFKYLKIPENDRNIILSFHTYSPMALTHYKANWVPMKDYQGSVHYPGQIITEEDYKKYVDTTNLDIVNQAADSRDTFNMQRLLDAFQPGIEYAKSKNLQLYCGEFGCLPTVDRKDRLKFYTDMMTAFEKNHIAWCNWEYKGDFGIYFFDAEKKISLLPDFELIHILLKNDVK